jgi:tetratricopeptide (TPR) repeat protein
MRCPITRKSLALFALALGTMHFVAPCAAQPLAQGAAAKECLRLNAQPADQIPWDQHERVYKQWADVCQQAMTTDGGDFRIKKATARAFGASGQREKEIVLLREMAAQNYAEALFDIYSMHNSFYRGDVKRAQLVTRAEAEQALRKAAELGNADAILRLAVLLDRGTTVKRDNAEAIRWAERAVSNPAKDWRPADMQVLLARLLAKSENSTEKVRGIALLEKLAQAGPYNAKTQLAVAIRSVDPVRARALFEQGLKADPGGAIPPLADMLIKGEGGPADPKRAASLLTSWRGSDVPGVKGALGMLYIEGKLMPRDLKKGIDLFGIWAAWDYDARLQLMKLLADNPELTVVRHKGVVYDATEAVELGEPGAAAALINLQLSRNEQFRDEAAGCKLVMELAKSRDEVALKYVPECNAIASHDRAVASYEKDDFDRAIADYSEAIKLNPKFANAYVGRGSAWYAKKEYDRAVADYDEAIRIDPKNGLGFLSRGFAWEAKKDTDRAIADYDEAIRLYPNYTEAYDRRGHAWQRKGNLDRAIADYGEAIRLDPKHLDATASRGRAYFYKGDFARSAADLSAASKLGDDAYSMLWHFLARGRGGADGTSELSGNVERLKSKAWPYAVIEFYLGRRSLDSMREAATKPDEKCEAAFYAGEWQLLRGNKPDARTALQIAADTCPKTFYEYNGAVAELKRIGN